MGSRFQLRANARNLVQRAGLNSDAELEEFSRCFMRKLWWLEMVNFIEVLEDIGCFGFWDAVLHVHVNLERIWH